MLPLLAGPTPAPPPPCPWLSVCAHWSLHCTRYLLSVHGGAAAGFPGTLAAAWLRAPLCPKRLPPCRSQCLRSRAPVCVCPCCSVPGGILLLSLPDIPSLALLASFHGAIFSSAQRGRWPSSWSQPESQERAERIPGAPQRPWPGAAGQLVSTAPLWARSGGPHSQKGVGFILSHPGLLLPLPDLNQNPLAPNSKDVDSPSLGRGEGWSLCLPRPRCHPGCFFSKTVNIDSALFC